MMNQKNRANAHGSGLAWLRRVTAFVCTFAMLFSSCGPVLSGDTALAQYSEDYRVTSDPIYPTTPLPSLLPSATPEADPEATPIPDEYWDWQGGALTASGDGWTATLTYRTEAKIPDGAVLTLTELKGADLYNAMKSAAALLKNDADEVWRRELSNEDNHFFTASITDPDGNTVQPQAAVALTWRNTKHDSEQTYFSFGDEASRIVESADGTMHFKPYLGESFGYGATVNTQIGTVTQVHEGSDYMVTASYGPEAGFPAGTELKVREIMPGTAEYATYSGMTDEALGEDWSEITLERYFDIAFVKDGKELEPQADIDVQISFSEKIELTEEHDVAAVHIENNEATVIETETESNEAAKYDSEAIDTVAFTSDSFSVYGVVQKKRIITKVLEAGGNTYEIELSYTQEAEIPENAQLIVEEIPEGSDLWEAYRIQTAAALKADDVRLPGLYDISIVDEEGNKAEPKAAVNVAIKLLNDDTTEDIQIVHFKEEMPQELVVEAAQQAEQAAQEQQSQPEPQQPEEQKVEQSQEPTEDKSAEPTEVQVQLAEPSQTIESETITATVEGDTVTFEAGSFSVFAFAYTVDFYYTNDGQTVEYHIPGGTVQSLRALLPILGIVEDDPETETDEVLAFLNEVESVSFSDESLVKVIRVDADITAGEIIDELGEEIIYSGNLDEETVADMRASKLTAPDWALVSLQPFLSEELLTITLKSGEVILVRVTDAQDPNVFTGKQIIIYDNTEKLAMTARWEHNQYRTELASVAEEDADSDETAHWTLEINNNAYFLKSYDGKYLKIDNQNIYLVGSQSEATPLFVEAGYNPDYRISDKNNSSNVLTYCKNNEWPGFFSAPGGSYGGDNNTNRWLYIREVSLTAKQFSVDVATWTSSGERWGQLNSKYFGTEKIDGKDVGKNGDRYPASGTKEGSRDANNGKTYFKYGFGAVPKDGYQLAFWAYQENGLYRQIPAITNTTIIPHNPTNYYAYYTPADKKLFIYQSEDTNMGTVSQQYAFSNSSTGSTANPKNGYQFLGWFDADNHLISRNQTISPSEPTKSMVLTAKFWDTNKPQKINIDVNNNSMGTVVDGNHNDYLGEKDLNNCRLQTTITAVSKDPSKYEFMYWTLDGAVMNNLGQTISPNADSFLYPGAELKAVFVEYQTYGSASGGTSGKTINNKNELKNWAESLNNDEIIQNADKTAKVKDYNNRIYQIDLSAESGLRRLTSTIDIAFILDMSGSMRFPSHLEPVKVNGENLSLLLTQANLNEAFPNDDGPYYIISDPQYTSTVYRITRIDGQWVSSDGSFNDRYVIKGDERFNEPAGSHYKYTIYRDVNPGTTRLRALNASMNKAVNSAKAILQNANGINGDNNLTVAYSRFAYEPFPDAGQYEFLPVSNVNAFNFTDSDTQGGTRQDLALTDALHFAWGDDTTHTKYAILITDGAPVAASGSGVDLAQVMTDIGTNATTLKTKKNVKLITVGLSTRNVQGGSSLLNSIASNGMFYDAESGDELEYILLDILRTIMAEANVCAEITDTVDPAFYPVTEDGTPIEAGYYSMDGDPISGNNLGDQYNPYYQWTNNNGEWTITWYNQPVGWKSNNEDWHKTFYIKAKEDFLGGNAMPTNKGSASVTPIAVYNGNLGSDNDNIIPITDPTPTTLETPYVNVRELAFTQGSSTITVPLDTIVDPLDGENAIKALFNAIQVKKLVSSNGADNRNTGTMLGSTYSEDNTFNLIDVIGDKITTGTDEQQLARWAKMLFGPSNDNTLVIRYPYGDHYRVGNICMTLTKVYSDENANQVTGDYTDKDHFSVVSAHKTNVVGTPVETYTLTVVYDTIGSDQRQESEGSTLGSIQNWHTTPGGDPGTAPSDIESINTHIINVDDLPKTTINIMKNWQGGNAPSGAYVEVVLGRYKLVDEQTGTGTDDPVITPTGTWTISFAAGDGGSGEMPNDTVTKGEKYTLPTCTFSAPSGMEFDRWNLGAPGDEVDITSDTPITAQWKSTSSEQYTVKVLHGKYNCGDNLKEYTVAKNGSVSFSIVTKSSNPKGKIWYETGAQITNPNDSGSYDQAGATPIDYTKQDLNNGDTRYTFTIRNVVKDTWVGIVVDDYREYVFDDDNSGTIQTNSIRAFNLLNWLIPAALADEAPIHLASAAPTLPVAPEGKKWSIDNTWLSDDRTVGLNGDAWSYTKTVDATDNEGNLYLYFIDEVFEYGVDPTSWTAVKDGQIVWGDHAENSEHPNSTLSVTNTYNGVPTPVEEYLNISLTKKWHDQDENAQNPDAVPTDGSVKFLLHQKQTTASSGGNGAYTIRVLGENNKVLALATYSEGQTVMLNLIVSGNSGTNVNYASPYSWINNGNSLDITHFDKSEAVQSVEVTKSNSKDNFDVVLSMPNAVEADSVSLTGGSSTTTTDKNGYPKEIILSSTNNWALTSDQTALLTHLPVYIENGSTVTRYAYWLEEVTSAATGTAAEYTEVTYLNDAGKDADHPITTSGSATVEITNTKIPGPGSLTVSKTIEDENPDQEKKFGFTVTIIDASGETDTSFEGTYGSMTFYGGVATFELGHEESNTADNLPAGTLYTVVENEANSNGYRTVSAVTTSVEGEEADGIIEAGETETVAFTNTPISTVVVSGLKKFIDVDATLQPKAIKLKLFYITEDGLTQTPVTVNAYGNEIETEKIIYPGSATTEEQTTTWGQAADWTDLPVPEEGYRYYVKETGLYYGTLDNGAVPANANWITNPESIADIFVQEGGLVTFSEPESAVGQAVVENRQKKISVPVVKTWEAFADDQFTWTATFQLEQMEVKVSGDDASDAIQSYTPVPGKSITISKGQTEGITFDDLPVCRVHSNGSIYRLLYSVKETAYSVSENGVVVNAWDEEHGQAVGTEQYVSHLIHGAGAIGDESNLTAEDPNFYTIILDNRIEDLSDGDKINVNLNKVWPNEVTGNSATFKLQRYYREGYREYTNNRDFDMDCTVSLSNGFNITVKKGAKVAIVATFKPGSAGKGNLVLMRKEGTNAPNDFRANNTNEANIEIVHRFDAFEVTEDLEYTIDNTSILQDIVITDLMAPSEWTPDNAWNSSNSQQFVLSDSNSWRFSKSGLPVAVYGEFDETTNKQTERVYKYYFEEVSSDPDGFYAEFTSNGAPLGDVSHAFAGTNNETVSITATNKEKLPFRVKKNWLALRESDLVDYPEVSFTLFQIPEGKDRVDVNDIYRPGGANDNSFVDIKLNYENNWTWDCPVQLPETYQDNGTLKKWTYYVIETPKESGQLISETIWTNPAYDATTTTQGSGNDNLRITVEGYRSRDSLDGAWKQDDFVSPAPASEDGSSGDNIVTIGRAKYDQPYNAAIYNTGEIEILNKAMKYIQMDLKKKFLLTVPNGTNNGYELQTLTSDPRVMHDLVLEIQVKRRTVAYDSFVPLDGDTLKPQGGDQYNVITPWENYGASVLIGYGSGSDTKAGSPVSLNPESNPFRFRYAGNWHWTIDCQDQNKGLPAYGFQKNASGEIVRVRYQYVLEEVAAWKNTNRDPLPNASMHWTAILPAAWDGAGFEVVLFPRIVAQDQDRLVNAQTSDLIITKEWKDETDVQEVYVKVWRKAGMNGTTFTDFTNSLHVDTGSMIGGYDGLVAAKNLMGIDNNGDGTKDDFYLVIPKGEEVKIDKVLAVDPHGHSDGVYYYKVQECGYKDRSGNVVWGSAQFTPEYTIGSNSLAVNTAGVQTIVLGTMGENLFKIINTPVTQFTVHKKWMLNGTEQTGPWTLDDGAQISAVEFKVTRNGKKYVRATTEDAWSADGNTSSDVLTFTEEGQSTGGNLTIGSAGKLVKATVAAPGGTAYTVRNMEEGSSWTVVVDGLQSLYEVSETEKWEYTYTIEEVSVKAGNESISDSEYECSYEVNGGTIAADGASVTVNNYGTATITNSHDTNGSLQVSKLIADGSNTETTAEFSFEITLKNSEGVDFSGNVVVTDKNRTSETVNVTDGKLTVSVTGRGTATVDGLPDGTQYEIIEVNNPSGWKQKGDIDYNEGDQVISAGETETAEITNEEVVDITIKKTWSDTTNWPDSRLTVQMMLKANGTEATGLPSYNDEEQTAVVTLGENDAVTGHTWHDLPKYDDNGDEISYTVEETGILFSGTPISNWSAIFSAGTPANDDGEFTIDNTPVETEIEVTKKWLLNGSDINDPAQRSIGFTVKQVLGSTVNEITPVYTSVGSGEPVQTTTPAVAYVGNGQWQTVKVSKLPAYILTDTGYVQAQYYVEETGVSGETKISYSKDAGETEGNAADAAIASGRITIFNKDYEVDIYVLKVNEESRETQNRIPLQGAQFSLKRFVDNTWNAYPSGNNNIQTSNENGALVFGDLPDGQYVIKEEQAPAGFYNTNIQIFFKIENGVVAWTNENGESISEQDYVSYEPKTSDPDSHATFIVGNNAGTELPATGGSGTLAYTLGGLALILLAGALWMVRKRRKA